MIARYSPVESLDAPAFPSTILLPESRDVDSVTRYVAKRKLLSVPQKCSFSAWSTLGEYQLHGEIGRGGMGIVYRARQVRLNRIVALKTLLPVPCPSQSASQSLRLEAEIGAKFDHPGIVPVHDIGESDGRPFFCMTLVEGENLATKLKRGPLRESAAARIVAEVAEAIQHVHERRYLHRDVKPGNILLDTTGRARLIDFGLAQRIDDAGADLASGSIAGTPSYMSPEQAAGRNELMGPASDVYSLGAVLYELLTGRPPHANDGSWAKLQIGSARELRSSRLVEGSMPAELQSICRRALQNATGARYASAKEMARDLRCFINTDS